jgi:hypothetical protein
MYDHDAGNRADETGDRSDGQIDVACDDHHHHADGEDEDVAVLDHQVGDVLGLQQNAVGQDLEQQDDQDQGDKDANLAEAACQEAQGFSEGGHVRYSFSLVM